MHLKYMIIIKSFLFEYDTIRDELNRIIFIISDTCTHSYLISLHEPCSKFEVLMILIHAYTTLDFDSSYTQHIHTNHKINMNRVRTLKYSVEGCVFALLAALSFLLMCPLFLLL